MWCDGAWSLKQHHNSNQIELPYCTSKTLRINGHSSLSRHGHGRLVPDCVCVGAREVKWCGSGSGSIGLATCHYLHHSHHIRTCHLTCLHITLFALGSWLFDFSTTLTLVVFVSSDKKASPCCCCPATPPSAFDGTSALLRRALCQCACDKVFLTRNAFNVKCEKGEFGGSPQKADKTDQKVLDCRIPCRQV